MQFIKNIKVKVQIYRNKKAISNIRKEFKLLGFDVSEYSDAELVDACYKYCKLILSFGLNMCEAADGITKANKMLLRSEG